MSAQANVAVNFKENGLDQVRNGMRAVRGEAEPTARRWGGASRQVAAGL